MLGHYDVGYWREWSWWDPSGDVVVAGVVGGGGAAAVAAAAVGLEPDWNLE
jgi:hypothetical protein